MSFAGALLFCWVFPTQDAAAQHAARLDSDHAAERASATEALLDMGDAARAALTRAAQGPSVEAAARAREILRILELRPRLTPALLREFPGIDRNLAQGPPHLWTETFLEAARQTWGIRRHPELGRRDLESLVRDAVRAALPGEIAPLCHRIEAWRLRTVLPDLLQRIPDCDPEATLKVVVVLEELEAKELVPVAKTLLENERDDQKQGLLRRFLKSMREPEEIDDVLRRFDAEKDRFDSGWGRAMAQIDPRKAVLQLRERIAAEPGFPRARAIQALLEVRHPSAIPDFRRILAKDDPANRTNAIAALAEMLGLEAAPEIRPFLRHSELLTRYSAAVALGYVGDPEALPVLREFAKDWQLAGNVVQCMGHYPLPLVEKDLLDLLRSRAPGFAVAAESLARLGSQESLPELRLLLKDKSPQSRSCAARGLAATGREEVIDLLTPLLDESDFDVLHCAIHEIKRVGGRKALDVLQSAAKNPNLQVSNRAVVALGELALPASAPLLIDLVKENDFRLHYQAFYALSIVDPPEFRPRIRDFLTDEHKTIRDRAAEWLARAGDAAGVDNLLHSGQGLFALNALRQPEAWKTLTALRLDPLLRCGGRPGLEELARRAGLTLEVDEDSVGVWLSNPEARTVVEALRSTEWILEKDRLVIVSPRRAKAFWRHWWEEQKDR